MDLETLQALAGQITDPVSCQLSTALLELHQIERTAREVTDVQTSHDLQHLRSKLIAAEEQIEVNQRNINTMWNEITTFQLQGEAAEMKVNNLRTLVVSTTNQTVTSTDITTVKEELEQMVEETRDLIETAQGEVEGKIEEAQDEVQANLDAAQEDLQSNIEAAKEEVEETIEAAKEELQEELGLLRLAQDIEINKLRVDLEERHGPCAT